MMVLKQKDKSKEDKVEEKKESKSEKAKNYSSGAIPQITVWDLILE